MVLDQVVQRSRLALAGQVRQLVVGGAPPIRVLDGPILDDGGWFGPTSVTWQVHADAAMFVGGLRALLLQTLHPLAMAGVAEHSAYRDDPLGRLARTSVYVGTVTYGDSDAAAGAVAGVRAAHRRVRGTAPDGRPYAADDPHLVAWVHHTLVDSFLRAYQRYGGQTLGADRADAYVAEQAVLGQRLGADETATSVAELREWFRAVRPELGAGAQARDAARFLVLTPPLPLTTRPAYGVIAGAALGLLPRWVRRQLWLPLAPGVDPLLVRPAARVFVRSLDWVLSAAPPADAAA